MLTGIGLGSRPANNLYTIFRSAIIENCEGATIESAAIHRGSAFEIVVNRGLVIEIQPIQLLLRGYNTIAV